jgi:GH15 family glucan-1,4-alpha-glucosidase
VATVPGGGRPRVRLLVALVAIAVVASAVQVYRSSHVRVPLLSAAVVVTDDGRLLPLGASDRAVVYAGTRVLQRPGLASAAREQARWLREGRVPGRGGPYEDMVSTALLDLRTLTMPGGASLAGWPQAWRYVWPRDAAFVAVALARTGHPDDALGVLRYLQRVQAADGSFQARYLPDGSGRAPDGRGEESDGPAWALWAAEQVVLAVPAGSRSSAATSLRPLVTRSSRRILDLTAGPSVLPPASLDYWEVRDERLSLGTAAPMAVGLRGAGMLTGLLGGDPDAVTTRAAALERAIEQTFGPGGYPRYAGDDRPDASVTFLLPPFRGGCAAPVLAAWRAARDSLRRPAGGLAPGAGWKNDGISWTAETALFALTAATTGDRRGAQRYLTWLDRHRTDRGALPEKVLSNGDPAGPAPLAWTAALVVLAVDALGQPLPRCD